MQQLATISANLHTHVQDQRYREWNYTNVEHIAESIINTENLPDFAGKHLSEIEAEVVQQIGDGFVCVSYLAKFEPGIIVAADQRHAQAVEKVVAATLQAVPAGL